MSNAGLALVLALAGTPATPDQAQEMTLAGARLEQRIAERGPIRTQVEAALTASAVEITAQAREEGPQTPASARKPDDSWAVWAGVLLALLVLFFIELKKNCCF